jgi:hypothetical protein
MTFGGGAIVGMVLGGATTYALAMGYNLTQTGQNMVRWTEAHFRNQVQFLIMLYLAVSHFGRGRGAWQDPVNNPAHWQDLLDQQIKDEAESWNSLWKKGGFRSDPSALGRALRKRFDQTISRLFRNLYPGSKKLFE